MQYVRELECYQEQRKAAVTLGKFDGLHRGHQKLVSRVTVSYTHLDVYKRQSIN